MYNADEWLYLEEFSLASEVDFPGKVKEKKWSKRRVQFLRFRFIFHLTEEWAEDVRMKPVLYSKKCRIVKGCLEASPCI